MCVPGGSPSRRAVCAVLSRALWCDCVFYDHHAREWALSVQFNGWCIMTFRGWTCAVVTALDFLRQHHLLCRHHFSFSCLPRCCLTWNINLTLLFVSCWWRSWKCLIFNAFLWIEIKRQMVKDTADASAVSTVASLRIDSVCGNNRLGIALKALSVGWTF